MDITYHVLSALKTPDYVFKHKAFLADHIRRLHSQLVDPYVTGFISETPGTAKRVRWRIDGGTAFGVRFFATPTCLPENGLPPSRIDVYIPEQSEHPRDSRHALGSYVSCVNRDMKLVANLGISKFVAEVLDEQSNKDASWLEKYLNAPFASKLVFENISFPDPRKTRVELDSSCQLETRTLPLNVLHMQWADSVSQEMWPPTLELHNLKLLTQVHDSISIVNVMNAGPAWGDDMYVFKSTTDDLAFLYHELHLLLSMPPSPRIIPTPLAIVTESAKVGGKQGVIGFILQYFPSGSIRDKIPQMVRDGRLNVSKQIALCQDVLQALIHVLKEGNTFYSDLRLDNILFERSLDRDSGCIPRVLLCDFEQRGNWYDWAPPEILYAQYAQSIRKHDTDRISHAYLDLLTAHPPITASRGDESAWEQMKAHVKHRNDPWYRLSLNAAEKAMTYQFGLFMYCVFEGITNPRRDISNAFPSEFDYVTNNGQIQEPEFPEFRITPDPVRGLIKACTIDASCWGPVQGEVSTSRYPKVVRRGYKLYPERHGVDEVEALTALGASQVQIDEVVLQAAFDQWQGQLKEAQDFLKSPGWMSQSVGSKRPSLTDIARRLEVISTTLVEA